MKIIHAADLHIDSPLRGLSKYEGAPAAAMRGATRRAFSKLIDTCIREQASLLLLVGDIYDGDSRDYNTAAFFNAELARLREAGTRVVLLLGNHDAASILTKTLPLPPHATLLDEKAPQTLLLEDLGVAVHGQSFAKKVVNDDLAARYPTAVPGLFNIGMLHTSLDGREGHGPYAPTTPSVLQRLGYDYFALGHVHAREIVSTAPYIAYPGNLQGRHAKETGPKGALLLEVAESRRQVERVTPVECDVLRWAVVRSDVTSARHRDDVIEAARRDVLQAAEAAGDRPLAARLIITGETSESDHLRAARDYVEHALRSSLGHAAADIWLEKVLFDTRSLPAKGNGRKSGDAVKRELLRLIAEGCPDPASMAAAAYGSLPVDARREDEHEGSSREFFESIVEDARALLLSRLEVHRED